MLVDVVGERLEPLGGADDLLELRPAVTELACGLLLLGLEHLLDLLELLRVVDSKRDLARLVVDRDGRLVFLRLAHPVDRDVVAEHQPRRAVGASPPACR